MEGTIGGGGFRALRAAWNSSHVSGGPEGGCSQADLRRTSGDGRFYCFAVN